MNAPFIVCLVLCIGFGVESVRRLRLDRAPQPIDPYHLLHGPNDGCLECEAK